MLNIRRVGVCWFLAVLVVLSFFTNGLQAGETLYNGIVLSDVWPPDYGPITREPMPVPYLDSPPTLIPIDVGRQLFVDDFLIESTTMAHTFHQPQMYENNPIVIADQPWEDKVAMVFSHGVWYDPQDKIFKMWYFGVKPGNASSFGGEITVNYATSTDGISWEKPILDAVPGTNIVWQPSHANLDKPGVIVVGTDSTTVWLDLAEEDADKRYKMLMFERRLPRVFGSDNRPMALYFSPDGIHWKGPTYLSLDMADRTTFFYNPFRKVWVNSIRAYDNGRSRDYLEHADVATPWLDEEIVDWVSADSLDPWRNTGTGITELYNLDAVAYESLMLGLFSIFHGNGDGSPGSHRHNNDITLGYSRDGFHWYRPDRRAFIGVGSSPTDWNWTNVQSAGGGYVLVGDTLYFYFSGRNYVTGEKVTGLAFLRRDGFASMDAAGTQETLTTRLIEFSGKYLFVNLDAPAGELRVEVLDETNNVIAPFSYANCQPVSVDQTLQMVTWDGADDLSTIAGQPVKLKFYLTNGQLYSFWISPDEDGVSYGYVGHCGQLHIDTNRDCKVNFRDFSEFAGSWLEFGLWP